MIISKEEFLKACNLKLSQNKKSDEEANIRAMYKEEQDNLAKKQDEFNRELQKIQAEYNRSYLGARNPREVEDIRERLMRLENKINKELEQVEGMLQASYETLGYELDALNSENFKFASSSINKELNI